MVTRVKLFFDLFVFSPAMLKVFAKVVPEASYPIRAHREKPTEHKILLDSLIP